ncbi:DnaB-like helicase C-terminal domain-containing protein [Enterococcus entomosocium]|uniref:DnaB-like helicase C-terminal domain-containing protein n=1 Tax=Enterococcus entomosocium TaxID=3034352 RepID=UPI0026479ECB|nr:DnaB-like helicase C-terminal domain-containing protein [Enterococcus entomosocium]
MSLMEHQLISKVLDDNCFYQLQKYGISEEDFVVIPAVYKFVSSYVSQYGNVPDYLTVVDKFEEFEYTETANNIAYMAKSLKSSTAKRKTYQLLQNEVAAQFDKMTGVQFANWLAEQTTAIAEDANMSGRLGTNLAQNGAERLTLYEESKEQGTGKFIATPYPSLTEWLDGGFELGDYVLLMAYTNKGKSWISADIAKEAWEQGYGVLDYRPEISRAQFMNRFDTLEGKFNNIALKKGDLVEPEEQRYIEYLKGFNETNATPYILKCMEDMPEGLSLKTIEADLNQNPEISVVIIDGFLLMDHGGNSREALAATSRKLRQLFARQGVLGIVVHQTPTSAEKDSQSNTAEDSRLPKTPDLTDYSETIAVAQDAVTVMTFNQLDGVGAIKLAKAKTPTVGNTLELFCNFTMGTIREPEILDDI